MGAPTRVGLALGSGSARGLAHIGVLEVLAEEGIPLHCVAGTSIGAVVGGLWATDSLERYKDILRGLSWWKVMGFFEPALSKAGIFSGGKLVEVLRDLTGEPRIEALPVRFVAVATDSATGQEVRLFRGDLVEALRASFAIPGLFTPVRWEERWLVDGGVKAPVPVEAAHALGATHVIAVNLNTRTPMQAAPGVDAPAAADQVVAIGVDETVFVGAPVFRSLEGLDPVLSAELPVLDASLLEPARTIELEPLDEDAESGAGWVARMLGRGDAEQPPGLAYTLTRSIDWMQVELADLQLQRTRPAVVIEPRCGDVKLFDYDRAAQVIEAGRAATIAALPQIRALLG